MTTEMIINFGMTAILGIFGWILKGHMDEVKRPQNHSASRLPSFGDLADQAGVIPNGRP